MVEPVETSTPDAVAVSGVVWDLGQVLIRWDPLPAIAAGVGEAEARRFLTDFDFGSWNLAQDAGRSWDEALDAIDPGWRPHGRAYREHFAKALLGPVEGTHELVRRLDAAGVPQFGLTNWSAELYPVAPRTYDVIGLLGDVVVSGEESLAKPDPAIYHLLAARIGIPLDRLAFVDDNPENVTAASDLGMRAIRFTDAYDLQRALRALGLPL